MNESTGTESSSLMLINVTSSRPATLSLEATAELAGLHPEMLRYYCRIGLFGEARVQSETEPQFDDDALFELRRIEAYRQRHNVDRPTLRLILDLQRKVERLEAEIRFLRGP